ncbi:hypothetical protein K438DRAFT_1575755 [Mycena galopus ATCC 62051]|nr:hypothetical protein K438DRAFT_1575755 [Mycena galopus ATCC 62051]
MLKRRPDQGFIFPKTDPSTRCPFCDAPLPQVPSTILEHHLNQLIQRSQPDSRPANPLGCKAPCAIFASLCDRHNLESKLLPLAEQNGWLQSIDWDHVKQCVRGLRPHLVAIIYSNTARGNCRFWLEALKEKGNGSVSDQWGTFQKYRSDYYGQKGAFIIQQTLGEMFQSVQNLNDVHPLSGLDFLSKVLVPEIALQLIMADFACSLDCGDKIRIESSDYGSSMFQAEN